MHLTNVLVLLDEILVDTFVIDLKAQASPSFEHYIEEIGRAANNCIERHVKLHVRNLVIHISTKVKQVLDDQLIVSENGSLQGRLVLAHLVNVGFFLLDKPAHDVTSLTIYSVDQGSEHLSSVLHLDKVLWRHLLSQTFKAIKVTRLNHSEDSLDHALVGPQDHCRQSILLDITEER